LTKFGKVILNKIKETFTVKVWMFYKKIQLLAYYLKIEPKNNKAFCVLKIDGRVHHGGLCDRLKSAVAIYALCKASNVPFKLYFSSPFNLKDILEPNTYNWLIDKEELSSSIINTKLITSYTAIIKQSLHSKKQIHVYNFGGGYLEYINSRFGTSYTFSELFSELFKPSAILNQRLEKMEKVIGQKYISACFRFQSLLGDFYEGEYFEKISTSYNDIKRKKLVNYSIESLRQIIKNHPSTPILVTSDSEKFLALIKTWPEVKTIPGKVVHMDFTADESINVYMKSYLDLLMLSRSQKIYRISGNGLYESGFPKVAALIGDKEIEFIRT